MATETTERRVEGLATKVLHAVVARLQSRVEKKDDLGALSRGTGLVAEVMGLVQKEGARLPGATKSEVVKRVVEALDGFDVVPEAVRRDIRALRDADLLQPMMDMTVSAAKGAFLEVGSTLLDCPGCFGGGRK